MTPKKPIMRGFTDADLKALQEDMDVAHPGMVHPKWLYNLVNRLRAAEEALAGYQSLEYERVNYDEVVRRVKTWLASKGEGGERNG
jgi:hypothetical protein